MASSRDSYALPEGVRVYSIDELHDRALRLLEIMAECWRRAEADQSAEEEDAP